MDKNFSNWIEIASFQAFLHPNNGKTKAITFLLAEDKKTFSAKLQGSAEYDDSNLDWTKSTCTYGQLKKVNDFEIKKKITGDTQEQAVEWFASQIKEYIAVGTNKQAFTSKQAVAVTFLDGVTQIVYKK